MAGYNVTDVYFAFDRLSMNAAPTRSEELARTLREKYPMFQIKNICRTISSLRAIKTPEEVACIRKAGDVTIEALKQMLRTAKPGEYEYQWQADYEHYVARSGLRHGFETIAASGENAVMLHYSDNNCVAKDGTLLLVDLGAEYQYYSADVSRTFPVGGKFTDRQKELFTIVREAMEIAKEKMRPGIATKESNQAVIDFYKKALRTAKLITDDSDVEKYYYHGVSHSLGLDTHDPCDRKVYEPGMVITCEPGLYVAEEGIGIRLENDILVTEGAPEDLIGTRLLEISEIEELMGR
ncbi:MAG: M24 family metallopeptidase [Oscillibacter sp.]|nr:M24 family metallopeptidase [Oscillibacter sp.]